MKKIQFLAVLSFCLLIFTAAAFAQSIKPLFKIERNKNANIVKYDIRMDAEGRIDKKNPMDAYWMLYADKGQRAEIGTFEKKAYGYNIKYNDAGYYDLRLKAVENRDLKVYLVEETPKAEIEINGKPAYLSNVYVNAKDGALGIPKVSYYTLSGYDVATGEEVSEQIDVK